MYVCICNAVTDKQIKQAVSNGCCSMRQLRIELGVSACCGKCAPCAQQLLKDAQACSQSHSETLLTAA
ncbi:bacterioferritin-associated ferredoxin [Parachitinimonas caeni]|uniref:Bacterioferritin-associated ferredoxin n=1 Tax=Parachitinimonas caeni TaxID=3031301 RepID=A0ABT7E167_9NEIS|nr:bacterioferritin-associated ferredoxin [Parachitinimonas caeni]MDK2126066.1 bacterioferritin-associated ferredoxin [Parachitinimonas caeni]